MYLATFEGSAQAYYLKGVVFLSFFPSMYVPFFILCLNFCVKISEKEHIALWNVGKGNQQRI